MLLGVLSSPTPMLRTGALLAISDLAPSLVADIDEDGVTMRMIDGLDELDVQRVPLAHSCMTCSLREGIAPYLAGLADSGLERLVLALPVSVEALTVTPSLCDLTVAGGPLEGITVTTQLHLVDLGTSRDDLFAHTPLAELGLAMFSGDERCTGEVLMNGVGYADLVCALGDEGVGDAALGLELVEHLRPLDTLMIRHLDELDERLLFSEAHDPDRAITRVHPASTEAWGGPSDHGVWTLDLHSERPFHPGRLAASAADLAPEGVCARGCFWIPSRPTMIGTWEVSGGSASIGRAGEWDSDAFTHLVVTGVGTDSDKRAVAEAFERLLMTPEEMADALAWVGVPDGMDSWFGDEAGADS